LGDKRVVHGGDGLPCSTSVIPRFCPRLTDSEVLIGGWQASFPIGFTLPQIIIAAICAPCPQEVVFVGPQHPVRSSADLRRDHGWWAKTPGTRLLAFFLCYGIAGFGDGLVGVPWSDMTALASIYRWRGACRPDNGGHRGDLVLIAPLIGNCPERHRPGFR